MNTSRPAILTATALSLVLCLAAPRAKCELRYLPGGQAGHAPALVQVEEKAGGLTTVRVEVRAFELVPLEGESRFQRVSVPGWGTTREPGRPALPVVSVPLLLNAPSQVVDVRVVSRSFDAVVPAPFVGRPKRCETTAGWRFTLDAETYSCADPYPGSAVEIVQSGKVRQADLQVLLVRPFTYYPALRRLDVAYTIEIDLSGSLFRASPLPHRSSAFDQLHRSGYYSMALPLRDKTAPETLLIISHDSLVSALEPLVEWKQQLGYNVVVTPLSEAGGTFQEVQQFISDAYHQWADPPVYVLLVGDGEGAGKVPFVPSPYGCASDFLYSTVDGDDLHSDVLVGRFSVHTEDEAALLVAKTIWYEMDIEAHGDSAWIPGSLCISSSEGQGGSNDDVRSDIICGLQADHGFSPTDKLYHSLSNDTADNISAKLNEGRGWVTYLGHGSGTSWATTTPPYANSHVEALANNFKLPFVVDVSCSNGGFDSPGGDCFAEAWTKTGEPGDARAAVGIYSSSTPAAWDEPAEMAVGIAHAVLEQGVYSWGAACAAGRSYMMEILPAGVVEETSHQYVVFGDPSLMLRTRQAEPLTVEHPAVVPLGGVDVEVSVSGPAGAVADATVVISMGDFLVLGKTGDDGLATLFVDVDTVGTLELLVFAANAIAYQGALETLVPGCGLLQVMPDPANCSSMLSVTLFDADLNTDSEDVETVAIEASCSAAAEAYSLLLVETGPDEGKFEGAVQLAEEPGQFKLSVADATQVVVSYGDEACEGQDVQVENSVSVDCVKPDISQVEVVEVTAGAATLSFVTDELALGTVRYGSDAPPEEETTFAAGLSHVVGLEGLSPSTSYLVEIEAVDAAGNIGVENDGGEYYQFETPDCNPQCDGKECGPDGCGGDCGDCCDGQSCLNGKCLGGPGCEPGDVPGCGGCACEECVCAMDPYCCQVLWDDYCVSECMDQCGGCGATPDCDGKECGADGCGGSCGDCEAGWTCTEDGECVDVCNPQCDGKECGSDGCFGSCGECDEGATCEGGICNKPCGGVGFVGCCVYDELFYCDEGYEIVVDCAALGLTCGWKETTSWYDCVEQQLPAPGPGGAPLWCPGTCPPKCDGKECGPDGCGGECGLCSELESCENGQCKPVCEPQCEGLDCGPDGCGGVCGECQPGHSCEQGECVNPCASQCEGKSCGPDGCGGSCGACAPGMECEESVCVIGSMEPDVTSSSDVVSMGGGRKSGGCSLTTAAAPTPNLAPVVLLLALLGALLALVPRSGRKTG